jgi:hypothetical protein
MKGTGTKDRRSTTGRALFYTRDSLGRHETTPAQYVRWAQDGAVGIGVAFSGLPEQIEKMIREGLSHEGDLFLDYGVTGNKLSRLGLDAMIQIALTDMSVSHVFIPRRDRLARPDDPVDGVKLENLLRAAGLTLVFMDRILPPLHRGRRHDLGELIVSVLEYSAAGEYRRELAQKIVHAQITLARAGFSIGGRAPFGFRRWLAQNDGSPVRQLIDGEYVKKAGHHVVWLPGSEEELRLIRRILEMLELMPAFRVAAKLTEEGVPPPDADRYRTDRGIRHRTSGVWHQTTISNIARNPLLVAMTTYGRRSMGDQLRFSPHGPRGLDEADLRSDGQPKVVANPDVDRIVAKARFEPVVNETQHQLLMRELDRRAGTQKGKPRSRTPEKNPLGSRLYDMGCGWPMYRQPYQQNFRYLCGLYQQSHGAQCRHNHVDGMLATRLVLGCIRQRLLTPGFRTRLEQRLRALAERDRDQNSHDQAIATKRAALDELRRKRERVSQNLAFAENADQRKAIATIFDQVSQDVKVMELQLRQAEQSAKNAPDLEDDIAAALADFDRLVELAADDTNLWAIGELFRQVDAKLFLRFEQIQPNKRKINKVAGGVVTFGTSPPPVKLYEGPTGRRALRGIEEGPGNEPVIAAMPSLSSGPDREGKSLGNINRGERI